MMRTSRTVVTFRRPFKLGKMDDVYPAGNYSITTDEELLPDVSFPAYRRTATLMQRITAQNSASTLPSTTVDPLQLEVAIVRDKEWTS